MTLLEYVKYIYYNFCKGLEYEKIVLEQLWKYYDVKEAYLWKHVPHSLLVDANIIVKGDNHYKIFTRPLQDLYKTFTRSLQDLYKTFTRPLQDLYKTFTRS
jgi:hypothetical protein